MCTHTHNVCMHTHVLSLSLSTLTYMYHAWVNVIEFNSISEVSVTLTPTPAAVRSEWMDMIHSGVLCIGEPCSPYTLTRYVSKAGLMTRERFEVSGRKISLHELRQIVLKKQEEFMRLQIDQELAQMGADELREILRATDYPVRETGRSIDRSDAKKLLLTSSGTGHWQYGTITQPFSTMD